MTSIFKSEYRRLTSQNDHQQKPSPTSMWPLKIIIMDRSMFVTDVCLRKKFDTMIFWPATQNYRTSVTNLTVIEKMLRRLFQKEKNDIR